MIDENINDFQTIIKYNRELSKKYTNCKKYKIKILSNITINPIKDILEFFLQKENIPVEVTIGGFDTIIQDTKNYNDENAIIIFYELINLINGFAYKIDLISESEFNDLLEKTKSNIFQILENLKKCSLILFNTFSSLPISYSNLEKNLIDTFCDLLNNYLYSIKKDYINLKIFDIQKIYSNLSLTKSIDWRYFYSVFSLYTIDFYISYCQYIKPIILLNNGIYKKLIIVDCDNTLWEGILDEIGYKNIELKSDSYKGRIFQEVRGILKYYKNNGMLLSIVSKNNFEDVKELFDYANNEDMILSLDDFVMTQINWNNKIDNIKKIINELNIGYNSVIFIDDSDYEIELVKKYLPDITTIKVPKNIYEYPILLRKTLDYFFNKNISYEDRLKTIMYQREFQRKALKEKAFDLDDYLKKLGLKLKIYINNNSQVRRISQLTQKTNQFNLTTKRFSEAEITNFLEDKNYIIYSFELFDNYGNYGLTGLSIVKKENNNEATIIVFLMSCRVIGRKVEFAFMDFIKEHLQKNNFKKIYANYYPTLKNSLVKNFYEETGFLLINEDINLGNKSYLFSLEEENYYKNYIPYIEVSYEK